MTERTYTVRYWGGPRDGAEEEITCGYPPRILHGYVCAYSKLGLLYQYTWARVLREKHAPQDAERSPGGGQTPEDAMARIAIAMRKEIRRRLTIPSEPSPLPAPTDPMYEFLREQHRLIARMRGRPCGCGSDCAGPRQQDE